MKSQETTGKTHIFTYENERAENAKKDWIDPTDIIDCTVKQWTIK